MVEWSEALNFLQSDIGAIQGSNTQNVHSLYCLHQVQQPNMRADQQIQDLDWELYLAETANLILQESSARRLLEVNKQQFLWVASLN